MNEIWLGDVLELAKKLPDNSIHCIVTSPPYWGLRDYGIAGQLGLEPTPEEYIEKMVLIFRELRRALREDGTLWMNLGDSYNTTPTGNPFNSPKQVSNQGSLTNYKFNKRSNNLKPKDLCGIPWRVALALQADGWYLRSDIIWLKPNPMPESVTDRPTKAHEYVFLLTKSARYFYDGEAIKEQATEAGKIVTLGQKSFSKGQANGAGVKPSGNGTKNTYEVPNGRNRRTVWEIATQPYPEAHFATYPEALVEPCILAGTSARGVCGECGSPWQRIIEKQANYEKRQYRGEPNGKPPMVDSSGWRPATILSDSWQPTCKHTEQPIPAIVLDPFTGSGTTLSVAKRLGRNWLGFELNPDYIKLAWKRLNATQPPLIVEDNIPVVAQYSYVQSSF